MTENNYRSKISPRFIKNVFGLNKPYEAFCELIDNSIDAGASEISIHFYDSYKGKLVVQDNGCGINNNIIKSALDYGTITKSDDKIGHFCAGLKATPYYFADENTEQVNMTIESFCNGKRIYVEKYINMYDESENLENAIGSEVDTLKPNGTVISFENISLSQHEYEQCKLNIAVRYCKLIKEGIINLVFNGESLQPIDMFYKDKEGVVSKSVEFDCHDGDDTFDVKVTLVDLSNYLKKDSKVGGSKTYAVENANPMDKNNKTTDFDGVYICCGGIYINVGEDDSFRHLGRRKHSYLNNCRVEIDIPMKYKRYFANVIKTTTKKYIVDVMDSVNPTKCVFEPIINWFKFNSPSKKIRQKTNEDKNKAIRNRYFDNSSEIVTLAKAIDDGFTGRKFITNDLRKMTIRLREIVEAVSEGRKAPNAKK